jgi:cob(I)alamin adenosyltransferase
LFFFTNHIQVSCTVFVAVVFAAEEKSIRIYTRTGDDGTTGLAGGGRAPKDSPVIEAGGDIDELSALIGIVRSLSLPDGVDMILQTVQERLLIIGVTIAAPESASAREPEICSEDILKLEKEIDAMQVQMLPLDRFIFPGGSAAGAQLHLARAVARRVERRCVALSRTCAVAPELIRWLNRLSDMLFVLARFVNQKQSVIEKSPDVFYESAERIS